VAGHLPDGHGVVAVVEHRIHQQLPRHLDLPPVPRQQREPRSEVPARAATREDDPARVATDVPGVPGDPPQAGVCVVEPGRERVLRGEPVGHRHHDHAQLTSPFQDRVEPVAVVTHDQPTAGVVDDRPQPHRITRAQHEQRDTLGALRAGHGALLDVEGPVGGQLRHRRNRLEQCGTLLGERLEGDTGGPGGLAGGGERGRQLRVERRRGDRGHVVLLDGGLWTDPP
jgi:hypothetical protein